MNLYDVIHKERMNPKPKPPTYPLNLVMRRAYAETKINWIELDLNAKMDLKRIIGNDGVLGHAKSMCGQCDTLLFKPPM